MAAVAVICLGLGGWNFLFRQYVEADPAVVGQPIKIRGRFFHFFAGKDSGLYVLDAGDDRWEFGYANRIGWGRHDVETVLPSLDGPGEFTVTLRPMSGSPIRGNIVVRAAD